MPRPVRAMLAALVLGATLMATARGFGPLPPLGPLLDPARGVWALARQGEPSGDRDLVIPGVRDPVQVVYDRRAVPHIYATNEADAYTALGWVVARDRLFQLHVQNLAAEGRLTEIGGAAALSMDREMRRLGLPRAAERKAAALDTTSASARLGAAYVAGINAYIAQLHPAQLPVEFRLLGVRPEPWTLVNVMHLMSRMGWTLAYLAPELDQWSAAGRVGREAAAALFSGNSAIVEPIQPNGSASPRFDFTPLPPPGLPDSSAASVASAAAAMLPSVADRGRGNGDERRWLASNNWAVSPSRTRDGHALLAGDPHLELTLPSIWYEAHLVVPGKLDVYGVTIPGAPGIVIGFNRDLAWTFTNTGADVLDFWAETVDDTLAPARYQVDGEWRAIERRVEHYLDRDGGIVATDTVLFTHRGPMSRSAAAGGRWLSMRWTVLEPGDELAAFQMAGQARTAYEFQLAMAQHYRAPAQNMLVADRRGTIAIRSTGRFPVRAGDGSGVVLRNGSRSDTDWRGDLPPDAYPQATNPAQGYVASANQQPVDPRGYPGWLGGSYDPWRALRINALLRADSAVTVDAMRRYQADPGSARAAVFAPHFVRAGRAARASGGAPGERAARAAELLAEWDLRYGHENTRAVLFEAAMTQLVRRTWDELVDPRADPTSRSSGRVATPATEVLARLLADSASAWWDDGRTPTRERRDEILAASLAAALDSVIATRGEPGSSGWRWDRNRHANIHHLLRIPAYSALSLPVPGGPGTLWPSSGSGAYGPSWRMVVELGPQVRAWGVYPGGQSGDPGSPRYRDRIPLWQRGELEPLLVPASADALRDADRAARITLRPMPKDGGR